MVNYSVCRNCFLGTIVNLFILCGYFNKNNYIKYYQSKSKLNVLMAVILGLLFFMIYIYYRFLEKLFLEFQWHMTIVNKSYEYTKEVLVQMANIKINAYFFLVNSISKKYLPI